MQFKIGEQRSLFHFGPNKAAELLIQINNIPYIPVNLLCFIISNTFSVVNNGFYQLSKNKVIRMGLNCANVFLHIKNYYVDLVLVIVF